MSYKSLEQLSVSGKRVFVRVDFNVPRDKTTGAVIDDTRIREVLPTLHYLIDQKAKIILASHLGRPKGVDIKESLLPVAKRLNELLDMPIIFPENCVGDAVRKLANELKEKEILLLENLRFHPEEESNDPNFAQQLAQLAEVYVTEAFGTLHRAHASTAGMVKHFKEKGIGYLVAKELKFLSPLLHQPQKPYYAILGGAKVSDKIGLIENLLSKVDGIFLGGGLAYTFLKVQGISVGKSRVEDDKIHVAQRILQKSKDNAVPIYFPTDHIIAESFAADAKTRVVTEIGDLEMGLDIGPKTAARYAEMIRSAKTIFWNGPMGVFEWPAFAQGTYSVAKAIAVSEAVSVVGGGESVAAIRQSGVQEKISHLSTGGGATLEYLEGRELPGLKAIEVSL